MWHTVRMGSTALSLLTPYVQELGIPHKYASVIWLCGPLSGFFVQPLVGHLSDRSTSRFGRRRPFIVAGAASIVLAVLIIGFSADIGWLFGDRGESKVRAIAAFVVGFWLLDVANNMTQGPCRALLADLTGIHGGHIWLLVLIMLQKGSSLQIMRRLGPTCWIENNARFNKLLTLYFKIGAHIEFPLFLMVGQI